MIEKRTVLGIAIVFCILVLGVLRISEKQEQKEFAKWAQEMNVALKESRAAESEIAELSRQQKEREEEQKKKEEAEAEKAKETLAAAPTEPEITYIASTALNVRAEKSTSARILGTVDKGDELPDAKQEGDWIRFNFKGKEAFVSAAYVREE